MPSLDSSLGIALIVAVILSICIYPVPLFIAFKRKHPNRVAIAALNLLTGWTFLGWVASLVWALTSAYQPAYANPSGPVSDVRATDAVYDPLVVPARFIASGPDETFGQSVAIPRSSRSRGMRLVAVGFISAVVFVGLILLVAFNARPKDIAIMGLSQSNSLKIKAQVQGGFDKVCRPKQIAPLDWPGGSYEAILYSCAEPKEAQDSGGAYDDYPAHVLALRKRGLLGSTVFAVDSNGFDDFSFTVGHLGERDAVFAQTSEGGNHPDADTNILIWDDTNHAPRLVDINAITSNFSLNKEIEYEGGLWPSWTAGSDEILFTAALLLPGDSYCCPSGGDLHLTYKTADGGKSWKLIDAERIIGNDSQTLYSSAEN